ncbi:MAG: TrpB-like pyridoxal phosphate-dependent enzyme [Candidatus Korarchaeota archaeon]|nr:TrpB-like pyridoxal phosphate-dependent enzyme [Candidatus Korarchaeota archaeon]NIU81925.1 TrpB-like pyridoxal phosphate-dependent enzyme [Candidatus Thorarchaeota archaeon]NIW12383.1 TrpB-like pyridoxal phosphate-dependent enzyme [Candidatus Thorarchaeota archaeon]NIW51175.1 TrpB-like pyridoxal phosphate-dependent enzyme [Candidatus Korarchaeota archaeon]
MARRKITLSEEAIPKRWYNIIPDLPKALPPFIDTKTKNPGVGIVPRIYPKQIIDQETSKKRWIYIPDAVREVYRTWRPTPLYRARELEKALNTPAKIYYKYEGVSPAGSHKPNTAVAQAYYNKKAGIERMVTETGAGQWGSALAFATMKFGLDATIYMVKVSYDQKPYRKVMMEAWGAEVFPSPSNHTESGKKLKKKDPDNPGSLGIAIGEAIEDAINDEKANYSLGSVLNHVLMHQTVIGLETKKQMDVIDEYPDVIFGCVGGGSSFSGLFWPFYHDRVSGKASKDTQFVATESTACPTVTKGNYIYDHGDGARLTPLLPMYSLGHEFIPPPIHAGGLRYHGAAPTVSQLVAEQEVDPCAYDQLEVFDAAKLFMETEGIIPAPEPAHAIKGAIDEALKCKETEEEKTILFLLCGHGHFDMQAYDDYFRGKLSPIVYPRETIEKAVQKLKKLYPWVEDVQKKFL